MDDMNDPHSAIRPRGEAKPPLPGWCAVAEPIVRSVSFDLARHYWLQPCDRQDLEQELWLELLVRHGGRDRADDYRMFANCDIRACRQAVWSQLRGEIERIAMALARSWPFWRRLRPAPERQMSDAVSEGLTAAGGHDALHRHPLRLDVAAFVAELPAADRLLCESLMAGTPAPPFDEAELERRMDALRADCSACDLHEYL